MTNTERIAALEAENKTLTGSNSNLSERLSSCESRLGRLEQQIAVILGPDALDDDATLPPDSTWANEDGTIPGRPEIRIRIPQKAKTGPRQPGQPRHLNRPQGRT